jgi:hypothetical protein
MGVLSINLLLRVLHTPCNILLFLYTDPLPSGFPMPCLLEPHGLAWRGTVVVKLTHGQH